MDDFDLPPSWISDCDLIRLIERVTKKPATLADAKAWRKSIERERARRVRMRYRQPVVPLPAGEESFHAFVSKMLASPEGQVLIFILIGGGSLAAELLDNSARSLYEKLLRQRTIAHDIRPNIEGLLAYANEKFVAGGRRTYAFPDPASPLPGFALAALNSATPDALTSWLDKLHAARRSPAIRPFLLERLRVEGADAMRAHPTLDIARPMSGPSLGLWPAPPPSPAPPVPDPDTAYVPPSAGVKR